MEIYDLIIIGIGPGGLSAAIYAARYRMKVLLIGKIPGGYAGTANDIRNYPGFSQISGMDLTIKIMEQAKALDVPIIQDVVTNVSKNKEAFGVQTSKQNFYSKKLILATGNDRRKLGIPNEKELLGKGISYCATCDAGFYKDKVVGIVGGGDAALTAALLTKRFAKKVYIFYRKEKFTKAEPAWISEVEKSEDIEVKFKTEIKEIIGKKKLEKIKLNTGEELELDGLFIEAGDVPNTALSEQLGVKLEKGSIIVDKEKRTNVEGVFAAGDVTDTPFKQIVTAAADGAIATLTAFRDLQRENSTK